MASTTSTSARRDQRRILIIGADGLRPDLLDPEVMPTVASLAAGGTRFADHHAVYPSHTRVNMSSLATGATPGRHGVVANTMQVTGATEDHIIDTADYRHLDSLATSAGGDMLFVPSFSDILARDGKRVAVAGTGSGGSNLLWTRNHRARIVNTNTAYGIADLYDLREKLGEIPDKTTPDLERIRYATRAVADIYLDDSDNQVIVVWFAEPDSSLHRFGLGSPESIAAMRAVDAGVADILRAMERDSLREQFDILFLSDHGHSTIAAHRTLREYLELARGELGRDMPDLTTASDYIYARPGTTEPTADQLAPLVEWLHAQPWCDVVLCGLPDGASIPGTIPLASLWNGASNPRRPLLAVSPRWSEDTSPFGVPGTVAGLTTQSALKSSHGSLSPYDTHALCIGCGPSFRENHVSDVPTGAIDIAPTVLALLGRDVPDSMDGRVLREGLASPPDGMPECSDELLAPTGQDAPKLRLHRVGETTYVHGSLGTHP